MNKKRILFVCLGNICRSPAAEGIFQHLVNQQQLTDDFIIDSAAIGPWHVGDLPDARMRRCGTRHGYDFSTRARQLTSDDFARFDYIIGMDTANIRNLNRMLKNDPDGKVYKFLSFTGSGRDIADPWYTGDFEATYRDVVEGCNGFLAYLRREGKI